MIHIIIPIYNVEKHLPACLESVKKQTCGDFRAILVDDGSADQCGEMCDALSAEDNRFITLHKANGGLVSAIRHGILYGGKCDYFMFLDGDDTLETSAVECVQRVIRQYSPDMIMFDCFKDYEDGTSKVETSDLLEGYYEEKQIEKIKIQYHRKDDIPPYRWNKVFRSELVLETLQYYNEKVSMAEDILFTTINLFCANKFFYLKKPLYHYKQHEVSMVHTYQKDYMESYKTVYQELSEYFGNGEVASAVFFRHVKTLIQLIVLYGQSREYIYKEMSVVCKDEQIVRLVKRYHPEGIKDKAVCLAIKHKYYGMLLFMFRIYNRLTVNIR